MAVQLNIKLKTTTQFIIVDKDWVKFIVTVTANGNVVSGATCTFSILTGGTGTWNPISGITNANGIFESLFKADEISYYNLQLVVTKASYTSSSLTFLILSYKQSTSYSSLGTLYLDLIEQKKIDILNTLANVLNDDDDFYLSTGASGTIQYLTEWNYQVKSFPLIVISNKSMTHQPIGINQIIDSNTNGNIAEVTFGLNVVCTNKNILDRLTQKVFFILGTYKYYELYGKYGIHLVPNSLSVGTLVTEPYGADFLYANVVSFNARIELAYNVTASDTIEDITLSGTIT